MTKDKQKVENKMVKNIIKKNNIVEKPVVKKVEVIKKPIVEKSELAKVEGIQKQQTSLMIGKTDVTKLLREKYKKLGKGWLTLLQFPTERHMDVNAEALKILINELGYECVYVTLSKPADELDKLYKTKGINTGKLFFIDAISQMYGVQQKSSKKVIYASGPLDIDSITASLREILSSLGEKKCVFLDSITTVLLYNSLPRTIRFSQFLTQTLKKIGVDGVMVSIAKGATTEKLIGELSKLCDEVINIE